MKHTYIMRLALIGTLVAVFAVASPTYAQTTNILEGRDLSVGDTGADVVFLQGLLSELGYLIVPHGVPLGYFGPLTKGATARYQASVGVINTGYYGPLTKLAMKSQFASHGWLSLLFPGFYQG